jgi:putative ABC transport system ATP-binding protein
MTTAPDTTANGRVSAPPAAEAVDLRKTYGTGPATLHALAGINVTFEQGRFTAVMGPSGSGKSTLMHCLSGLDRPPDLRPLPRRRARHRRARRCWPDQAAPGPDRLRLPVFNLVPTLTAAENITLPVDIAGRKLDRDWFGYLVDQLGIADRLGHRPSELSGGQQQRVACARALIAKPDLIFADEPTGNLDSAATASVLAFLRTSVTELEQSIVMVTHDPNGAAYADQVLFLADGAVVGRLDQPTADSVLDRMRTLGA